MLTIGLSLMSSAVISLKLSNLCFSSREESSGLVGRRSDILVFEIVILTVFEVPVKEGLKDLRSDRLLSSVFLFLPFSIPSLIISCSLVLYTSMSKMITDESLSPFSTANKGNWIKSEGIS